jgi:RNA polymerase sigma-70 factor, ECF subfamily
MSINVIGELDVEKMNDPDLVLQLQNGSLEALGEIYDRHRNLVYRTALVITGDRETASDLLQHVFLRLYRFADRIDWKRPLEPWLYRITPNLSYTWVKRNSRWIHPLDDITDWITNCAAIATKNQPYETIEKRDDWDQVQKAVLSLPIQQRVVVVLYYLNDLSLLEISEILDVPIGTIKSRLHYGRNAIKKKLTRNVIPDTKQFVDLHYEKP